MDGPLAYVFDAYGTLFDVHSAVARHQAELGPEAAALSELWRTKQLEYTWVRSLMQAYRDFEACTRDALDHAAARLGVDLSPEMRERLLAAYETLEAYPDVRPALQRLRQRGARTAILSNGTPRMLERAVASAGLADLLDAVLSVDGLRVFKTDPRAYRLAVDRLGTAPGRISFQSSNRWDIAGAARFGCHAVWVNRTGQPDEYPDLPPARVITSLEGLLEASG